MNKEKNIKVIKFITFYKFLITVGGYPLWRHNTMEATMTLLLIALIIAGAIAIASYADKQTDAKNYRLSNQGSRHTELFYWEFWSEKLLREYNELTGYNYSMPEIRIRSLGLNGYGIGSAYYDAFGNPSVSLYASLNGEKKKDFFNKKALETLRKRYNLPSNEELAIMKEGLYYTGNIKPKEYYNSLFDVIKQCVKRSVYESGYKYGGTDWIAQESAWYKSKDITEKYPYLGNDPSSKK